MRQRSVVVLIGLLFLSACGTTVEFVRKDTSPRKQGVLRYEPYSDLKKEANARNELTKKANEFCGPAGFEIIKEYQAREESGTSRGLSTGIGFGSSAVFLGGGRRSTKMYNFVEFQCRH